MFRGSVAVLISCSLIGITFHQYMEIPGHQIDQGASIAELTIPILPGDSLHFGSRELALITGASSFLVVALAMVEAFAF
jgi:hypothetical protein